MSAEHESDDDRRNTPDELERAVEAKGSRKIKSRVEGKLSPWFGLGMFGVVGWSIVLPTLIGIALGSFIDSRWPSQVSWKLTLLFVGVAIGCANAWYWLQKETS